MPPLDDKNKAIARLLEEAFAGTRPAIDLAAQRAGYIRPGDWKVRSRRLLALFFGIHHNTVPQWESAGMPIARKSTGNQGNEYDLAACCAWRLKMLEAQVLGATEGDDDNPELTRLRRISADIKEIELGELIGQMVRRKDVDEVTNLVVATLTSSLTAARDTLARLVPDQAEEIHRRLDELLDRIRGQLGGAS